ncbi:Biomphalysin 19 [Biomphalaria glabrata]|nr:Biomphalysin 19 [Biomphalaria glabrata]
MLTSGRNFYISGIACDFMGHRRHLNGLSMMLFSKLWVALTILGIVDALCTESLWSNRINYHGQSTCKEPTYYMNGLQRDHLQQNDGLHLLKGAVCCSAPSRFLQSDNLVLYKDWTYVLEEKNDIWANCPEGYFLHGLQRSQNEDGVNYLHNIEYARCVKPSNHPHYYGDCYAQNITFNKQGVFSCKTNFFITGIHKVKGDYLHHIDKLYCCAMEEEPEIVYDVDTFKRVIMENTMNNLVRLAMALGYGHCAGNKAIYVGDDFYRDGDSWIADHRLFWGDKKCNGEKCEERLKIDYLDWSFNMKDIIYSNGVIDELKPERVYEMGFQNNQNNNVTKTFEYKNAFSSSITHSTSISKKTSFEYTVSMEVDAKFISKIKGSIMMAFENSELYKTEMGSKNGEELVDRINYSIPAQTFAKYKVFLSKIRTTTPYTAIFIAKFNVRFTGMLRYGGGYASKMTNFHYQYKGSTERPSFTYTFGDDSDAFYTALKLQSRNRAMPWLWKDIFKNSDRIRDIINSLTNETKYQFILNGKFEQVYGKSIHSLVDLTKLRSPSVRRKRQTETFYVNDTFIAKAGPDDKPVEVNYPEISLQEISPIELEPILNDPDSS